MENITIERSVLDELVNGILEIIPHGLAAIVLYGSAAKGTASQASDIDIALLFDRPLDDKEKDQLDDFIVDMDLKHDKVFSVIDVDNNEMQKHLDIIPFYRNVQREGIVLWKSA